MKKKLIILIFLTCALLGGLVYAAQTYYGTSKSVEELEVQVSETQATLDEKNAEIDSLNSEIEKFGGDTKSKVETKKRWEELRDTVKNAVENPKIEESTEQ